MRRQIANNIVNAALLGLSILLGSGATYYVETTGSLGGDGSDTNPWPTIAHALSQSGSGDTINIGPGEFREFLLITNPVTLVGQNTYSAGNAPLNRHSSVTEIRASAPVEGPVITVMTNNVTIRNLTIYGDPDSNGVATAQNGIYTPYRPVNIETCKIANIFGRGIEYRGLFPPPAASDTDTLRSYVGYNMITNVSATNYAGAIYFENTQATVEYNEISSVTGQYALAGIYVNRCDYTDNMSEPIIVRSNFINNCLQAIWAKDPIAVGETLVIDGNTITNSLIGIRLTEAGGQASIIDNSIHVTGLSPSGLTPARGIWIHGDQDPWSINGATDHSVIGNTLISEASTNDGTIGMLFSYKVNDSGPNNNGLRATVLTNYVYFFATGSLIESGTSGVTISNDPLVEVVYHCNDIYGSVTSAITTTGFSYIVDATTNFLGYADPSNMVSTNVNYTGWTLGSCSLDTDGDGWLDQSDDDDDGDGWNDTNEYAVGTHPNRADSDSDGMNDREEYIVAGTDPMDSASVLTINGFQWTSTNGASFEWPSVSGRTYYVYISTNLLEGFGSPITNFAASTPTNYYTNSAAGPIYFYQVSVTN